MTRSALLSYPAACARACPELGAGSSLSQPAGALMPSCMEPLGERGGQPLIHPTREVEAALGVRGPGGVGMASAECVTPTSASSLHPGDHGLVGEALRHSRQRLRARPLELRLYPQRRDHHQPRVCLRFHGECPGPPWRSGSPGLCQQTSELESHLCHLGEGGLQSPETHCPHLLTWGGVLGGREA